MSGKSPKNNLQNTKDFTQKQFCIEQEQINQRNEIANLKRRLDLLELAFKTNQTGSYQSNQSPILKQDPVLLSSFTLENPQNSSYNEQFQKRVKTDCSQKTSNNLTPIQQKHNEFLSKGGTYIHQRNQQKSPLSQKQKKKSSQERASMVQRESLDRAQLLALEISYSKQESELQRLNTLLNQVKELTIKNNFKVLAIASKLEKQEQAFDQKLKLTEINQQQNQQTLSKEINQINQIYQDLKKDYQQLKDQSSNYKGEWSKFLDQQINNRLTSFLAQHQIINMKQQFESINNKIQTIEQSIKNKETKNKQKEQKCLSQEKKQIINEKEQNQESDINLQQQDKSINKNLSFSDNLQNLDNKYTTLLKGLNDSLNNQNLRIKSLEGLKNLPQQTQIDQTQLEPITKSNQSNQNLQEQIQQKLKKVEEQFNTRIIEQNRKLSQFIDSDSKGPFIKLINEAQKPHVQFQESQVLENNRFQEQIQVIKKAQEEFVTNYYAFQIIHSEFEHKLEQQSKIIDEEKQFNKKLIDSIQENLKEKQLNISQFYHIELKNEKSNDKRVEQEALQVLKGEIQKEEIQGNQLNQMSEIQGHPNKIRLQKVQDLINDIYNQSWRKRSAQGEFLKFIRDQQNLNDLYKNYGVRSSQMKAQLAEICNAFRQARGDGNCFYTAFGFQFFNILLFQYTNNQYQEFIKKMNDIITFKINYGEQKQIDNQELQQQCWEELKYRLEYLRNMNDKEEFIKHYQAYEQSIDNELIDGCFYGLSTIFFRNLANYLVDNSEMKQAVFDQYNLLIWETECNSNEVIIDELAKYLQVHVKLVFFEQGAINLREYSQEMEFIVILLIRPGHYNIGLKINQASLDQQQ